MILSLTITSSTRVTSASWRLRSSIISLTIVNSAPRRSAMSRRCSSVTRVRASARWASRLVVGEDDHVVEALELDRLQRLAIDRAALAELDGWCWRPRADSRSRQGPAPVVVADQDAGPSRRAGTGRTRGSPPGRRCSSRGRGCSPGSRGASGAATIASLVDLPWLGAPAARWASSAAIAISRSPAAIGRSAGGLSTTLPPAVDAAPIAEQSS